MTEGFVNGIIGEELTYSISTEFILTFILPSLLIVFSV